MTGHLEIFAKAPDMETDCVTLAGDVFFCRGYDGKTGWSDDSQNGLKSLDGPELEELRLDADFYSELDRRKKYPELKIVREDVFNNLKVYVLQGVRKNGRKDELYFARETGLEVGAKEFAEPESESKIHYLENYQEIAGPGVKFPARLREVSSKATVTINLEEIIPNSTLADSIFAKPPKSARDPKGAGIEGRPDNGRVIDGVYTNDFLAFRYILPQGWTVHGEETRKVINEAGRDLMAGDDQNKKNVIDASAKRTADLLTVFEFPLGTPNKPNRGIQMMAENVSFAPGIQTGKDYLLVMNKALEGGQMQMQFEGDPTEIVLDGTRFYREGIHFAVGNVTIHEVILCTLLKSYALSFIFSAQSKEKVEEAVKSLESFHRITPSATNH